MLNEDEEKNIFPLEEKSAKKVEPTLENLRDLIYKLLNTREDKQIALFWRKQTTGLGGQDVENKKDGLIAKAVPSGVADMIIEAEVNKRNKMRADFVLTKFINKAAEVYHERSCLLPAFFVKPISRKQTTHDFYKILASLDIKNKKSIANCYRDLLNWEKKNLTLQVFRNMRM